MEGWPLWAPGRAHWALQKQGALGAAYEREGARGRTRGALLVLPVYSGNGTTAYAAQSRGRQGV